MDPTVRAVWAVNQYGPKAIGCPAASVVMAWNVATVTNHACPVADCCSDYYCSKYNVNITFVT